MEFLDLSSTDFGARRTGRDTPICGLFRGIAHPHGSLTSCLCVVISSSSGRVGKAKVGVCLNLGGAEGRGVGMEDSREGEAGNMDFGQGRVPLGDTCITRIWECGG